MNDTTWWYIARSGGIVGWGLLAGSVLWGLALSTKVLNGKPRPNWILDLHRFLGGLALVFTGIHVVSLLIHRYARFRLLEVLLPFTNNAARTHVSATAVAWGVIGMYLLVAVEVTSLLRKKLSKKVWRMTHYLSFPLFALVTLHGLTAGSDRHALPFQVANVVVVATVAGLTTLRLSKADQHDLLTSPPNGLPPRSRVPRR
jgi:predicted ferric reductase